MKKYLIIVSFFLQTWFSFGQLYPGKMKITVKDKLTDLPLVSTTLTVTLNSTDQVILVSNNEGDVITNDLKPGKYKVEISCSNYQPTYYDGIMIGEGKTCYIAFGLIPSRPLTKKEKKQLGIK